MRVRVFLLAVLAMALFPVTASANYPHVVESGETLTSVAAVDGLSVGAIAAANGMSEESQLITGQILWIPPQTLDSAGVASDTSDTSSSATTEQTDATTADSQSTQTEDTSYTQPESSSSSSTSSSESSSSSQPSSTEGTPQPTEERVSSSQIAYMAEQYGVPAGFAEAIAWQESGWNNSEVSGVGAVGVMQIVPGTWDWIDHYLTPSSPLGTASASENIRAGVLLLHELLSQTGGSEQMAAAAYYQGLASVQAHGMYADTQQYVADVLALAARFGS